MLGVERSDTGLPIALLATLGDVSYVGNAMVTLNDKERAKFWKAVGRRNAAEPAGLTKRKSTSWLNLRGEDMLRHAGLQTLDPRGQLPGKVVVKRHGEGE